MTKILVTGAAGFIGHHLVEHIYKNTDWDIVIVDKLSYASNGYERLRDTEVLENQRVTVFTFDLSHKITPGLRKEFGDINYIVHMAAETHVDNSIADPVPCIKNNVMSTVHLLEYARILKNLRMFAYFSTDEVFGPAVNGKKFTETAVHNPTNPYAASKSAAESICMSYENTYKIPLVTLNVMNVFGERQFMEKFIPNTIKKVLEGGLVQIHTYPDKTTPGSRFYIHARNVAAAVLFILRKGVIGDRYNITGEREMDNLQLAQFIAKVIGKELRYELLDFHSKRPGHDVRYALDGTKLQKLGFSLPLNFEESLRKTILWTVENKKWLNE